MIFTRHTGNEDGIALISVLWAVTAMSLIAATIVLSGSTSLQLTHRLEDRIEEQTLGDAALARAILGVTDPDPAKRYPVDGTPEAFEFGGTRLSMAVTDELGKVDLNESDATSLQRLLDAAGASPDQAIVIANEIVEWRTDRSAPTAAVAAPDAGSATRRYQPCYCPFQSIDELNLVPGVTEALFQRLKPAITVYSHRPAIDRAVAPRLALAAQGLDPAAIDELIAQRSEKVSSTIPLPGHALSVHIVFSHAGHTISREDVVELSGNGARPFFKLRQN